MLAKIFSLIHLLVPFTGSYEHQDENGNWVEGPALGHGYEGGFEYNLIGEADVIVYYAYPHPDKNVMENNRMLGRVFGEKIIPVLKEKEYIKEVTNLDTILPFVNNYLQNMKKALKEAQIKSIS
ncbi:MAG: hypothetical protein ACI4V7_05610 [Succinivibrionaceae bacterium]